MTIDAARSKVNARRSVDNAAVVSTPALLPSLARSVSPPRTRQQVLTEKSSTAAVEAGEKNVEDHLNFFSEKLLAAARPPDHNSPRLTHENWTALYTRNVESLNGHHFVIHQHDHPVAGTHYDLRLQCNGTSSISFAIMYGLPGDPNSRHLNRNATETRVHNLWNHLIETASHSTGTILIWDTGEYEVIPFEKKRPAFVETTGEEYISAREVQETNTSHLKHSDNSEQQKLHIAFQKRKIRLRLHGTRLPYGYTISLRLTQENFRSEQPQKPKRRRRKAAPGNADLHSKRRRAAYNTSDSEVDGSNVRHIGARLRSGKSLPSMSRMATPPSVAVSSQSSSHSDFIELSESGRITTFNKNTSPVNLASGRSDASGMQNVRTASLRSLHKSDNEATQYAFVSASDNETLQDEQIRLTNAYTGASNTINSIHQRRWYLSLDRQGSGFIRKRVNMACQPLQKVSWVRPDAQHGLYTGFEPFLVMGRDAERSVVTGRLAREILEDEGVTGYMPRGKWRGVVE